MTAAHDCSHPNGRRAAHDGRGYFLTYVCQLCERAKLAEFDPEILSIYAADDLGEEF